MVSAAKIAESIMAGQHFTLRLRDDAKLRLRPAVNCRQLLDITLTAALERRFILRVGFHQAIKDILRVQRAISGAIPGVRIGHRFTVFIEGMRLNPF